MGNKQILKVLGDLDEKFIKEAMPMPQQKNRKCKVFVPIAACVSIILIFSATAMAANLFGIRNLLLSSQKEIEIPQGDGEFIERKVDIIGLGGYIDSPESKALAEWEEFYNEYDIDKAISKEEEEGPAELDNCYSLYSVYDQNMADKLDEIAKKYNLKLHSEINIINPEELVYRVGDEFLSKNYDEAWAYIYEDGTFQFDGSVFCDDCGVLDFQFRRTVKGTFDQVTLNINNVNDYEVWEYVTDCGEKITIALGTNKSLIWGDFDECFIVLNILQGSYNGVTKLALEEMADGIDFTVLKNVKKPDMRGDSEV